MLKRFAKLSPSEKRLSVIVAVLFILAIAMVIGFRCMDALQLLDETIASQELLLLDDSRYSALAGPVDEAYDAIAKQHSSEWTQEQIHDRLRTEIARLSLRRVPDEGTALPAVQNPGDLLVDIRAWPMGALDDSGEGFRTYQINFRTEPTSIQNIATFLERLQQSPQALRVEGLELTRQPLSTEVTAAFRVARTVIGEGKGASPAPAVAQETSEKPTGNLIENADFAQWDAQTSSAPGWNVSQAALTLEKDIVAGGDNALAVHAQGANAELYQDRQLVGGATYEVTFVAKASGAVRLRILNSLSGEAIGGDVQLQQGATGYQYRYRFTAPGEAGAKVSIRLPMFVIEQSGATLVLDNVSVQEASA
ncbi:MAG: hypothetical protein IT366_14530 [Candidatus Hydrogenedentes bacterium]|nr:hypothetical protein [Candidatus Hydrogenedentota bacterium]